MDKNLQKKLKRLLLVTLISIMWLTYWLLDEEVPKEVKMASEEILKAEESSMEIANPDLYVVTEVVDGDTIKTERGEEVSTIRLIGIDTPEVVDPRKPVQCFGKEASTRAQEVLADKKVRLETDSTQGEKDKYGRLLRYVYLEDGTFYNKLMIEEGYAYEYTYDSNPYQFQNDFREMEKKARENKRGLWNENTCNQDR